MVHEPPSTKAVRQLETVVGRRKGAHRGLLVWLAFYHTGQSGTARTERFGCLPCPPSPGMTAGDGGGYRGGLDRIKSIRSNHPSQFSATDTGPSLEWRAKRTDLAVDHPLSTHGP